MPIVKYCDECMKKGCTENSDEYPLVVRFFRDINKWLCTKCKTIYSK